MPRDGTRILLYGATGFTGKLTASIAANDARHKLVHSRLILGGRSQPALNALHEQYGFPYRVFSLESVPGTKLERERVDEALADVRVVILMAGPFQHTALPMLQACIRNQCHYLDITGEQGVFELIHETYAQAIRRAGIVAIPGVGFDVVPTDCLAAMLHHQLPSATHLALAFGSNTLSPSAGTMVTGLEGLATPPEHRRSGARIDGRMVNVAPSYKTRDVDFPTLGKRHVGFIPWGDCYTAFVSTGIPNIDTFLPCNRAVSTVTSWVFPILQWVLLYVPYAHAALAYAIRRWVPGPTETVQAEGRVDVWGEAFIKASHGEAGPGAVPTVRMSMVTPEPYVLTAHSALVAAQRVFENDIQRPSVGAGAPDGSSSSGGGGPLTPSQAFGMHFIEEIMPNQVQVHPPQWIGGVVGKTGTAAGATTTAGSTSSSSSSATSSPASSKRGAPRQRLMGQPT